MILDFDIALLSKDKLRTPSLSFNRSVFLVGFCIASSPILRNSTPSLKLIHNRPSFRNWPPPNEYRLAPKFEPTPPTWTRKQHQKQKLTVDSKGNLASFFTAPLKITSESFLKPEPKTWKWSCIPFDFRHAESQIRGISPNRDMDFSRCQWEA